MTEPDLERDELEVLAAEFVERQRHGENPSIAEYAAKYPQLAQQIRELFPTISAVERLKIQREQSTGMRMPVGSLKLERLGEFRIIGEIGRGGMGVVFEAEQESLARRVAIKVLPRQAMMAPDQLKRFQREAQIAAQLHHANIVNVFGVGEHEGLHYYIMQLIHGVGLDKLLTQLVRARDGDPLLAETQVHHLGETGGHGAVDVEAVLRGLSLRPFRMGAWYWDRAARIALQAAQGLEYAHREGTLHCDIKPANLLLDGQGLVWITDFGVAKALQFDKMTRTGDVTGTLHYMAPERFQGQTDARSDVYSLGLTLYELLTLRPAFEDHDRQRLIRQILDGAAPPPRQFNAQIPRDLETIVLKAIARDPGRRYQSAGALADDLQRYLDARTIEARRISRAERLWGAFRRHAMMAILVAVNLLWLTVLTVVVAWGPYSRPVPPDAEGRPLRSLPADRLWDAADRPPEMGPPGRRYGPPPLRRPEPDGGR